MLIARSKLKEAASFNVCAFSMRYLILVLLPPTLTAATVKTVCNKNPYGTLELAQCLGLGRQLPDGRDNALRIFDEEQLGEAPDGSWPGIRNPFKTSVVQIPRIWSQCKHSLLLIQLDCDLGAEIMDLAGCNIALMSFSSPPTFSFNNSSNLSEVSRVGATSWSNIVEAISTLTKVCVNEQGSGGAVVVESRQQLLFQRTFVVPQLTEPLQRYCPDVQS